jgi:hypothetical protein
VVHFYLNGWPVAQLAIDGAGSETWSYLTTDHLGTPLLATDGVGGEIWEGGFEPFGRDYQAGTPAGALDTPSDARSVGGHELERFDLGGRDFLQRRAMDAAGNCTLQPN